MGWRIYEDWHTTTITMYIALSIIPWVKLLIWVFSHVQSDEHLNIKLYGGEGGSWVEESLWVLEKLNYCDQFRCDQNVQQKIKELGSNKSF